MRNLGPVSQKWLQDIDIYSLEELKSLGAAEAYLQLLAIGIPENLNLLWSLYGAIHNKKWTELTEEEKKLLKEQITL